MAPGHQSGFRIHIGVNEGAAAENLGDIESLAASINESELLHPIVVTAA